MSGMLAIEWNKEKRTGIIPVLLSVGILGAAYAFLNYAVRKESLLSLDMAPMDILLTQLYGMLTLLNMLGIIVASCMIYNMEFKGNAIRKMYMLPVSVPRLYLCKSAIITVTFGMADIIQFAALAVIGAKYLPAGTFDPFLLIKFAGYAFVTSLPVITFMILVSSIPENIWISLGMGITGLLSGIALANSSIRLVLIHPFVTMFQPAMAMSSEPDGLVISISVIISAVFLITGLWISKNRNLE